jgi:hypothetical protein
LFLIELVSPNTRENDVVHKMRHYFQLKIPLYILVDWEREDGPRTLRGYRYDKEGWIDIAENGRVVIERFGVTLEVRDGQTVALDLRTGEVQLDFLAQSARVRELLTQLGQADEKHAALEQSFGEELDLRRTAQAEVKQAVAERKQAEQQAKAEAKERQKAEDRAKQAEDRAKAEANERKKAEDRAISAANERKQADERAKLAEDRAKSEANERKKAEDQVQQLLAELQRLRGKPA